MTDESVLPVLSDCSDSVFHHSTPPVGSHITMSRAKQIVLALQSILSHPNDTFTSSQVVELIQQDEPDTYFTLVSAVISLMSSHSNAKHNVREEFRNLFSRVNKTYSLTEKGKQVVLSHPRPYTKPTPPSPLPKGGAYHTTPLSQIIDDLAEFNNKS